MFRQIFSQSRRFFSKIPLVTTLIIPLWILNKTRKYTAELPPGVVLKSKPKVTPPLEI